MHGKLNIVSFTSPKPIVVSISDMSPFCRRFRFPSFLPCRSFHFPFLPVFVHSLPHYLLPSPAFFSFHFLSSLSFPSFFCIVSFLPSPSLPFLALYLSPILSYLFLPHVSLPSLISTRAQFSFSFLIPLPSHALKISRFTFSLFLVFILPLSLHVLSFFLSAIFSHLNIVFISYKVRHRF